MKLGLVIYSFELCPISTMQDLYTLVQTCDKTLTF